MLLLSHSPFTLKPAPTPPIHVLLPTTRRPVPTRVPRVSRANPWPCRSLARSALAPTQLCPNLRIANFGHNAPEGRKVSSNR